MTSSVIVCPSHEPKSNEVIDEILMGKISHEIAGGGGGYGDPLQRPVEKVLKDVRNGFVSIEKAKEDYAVVADPLTYQVDEEETRRLRGSSHTQND
jgi:N-methylhydantoinase B